MPTLRNFAPLLVTVGLVLAAVGCGPSQNSSPAPSDTATSPSEPAPAEPTGAASSSITVKGSDTMVHLVAKWAEAYMAANSSAKISVTGGGSGTGIAAILNKTTDICASSRDLNAEEIDLATKNGLSLVPTVVAQDALAIAVNPANTVSELTMEQIKAIFTGAVKQWDQVGGTAEPIVVLSRESSSGTYLFFLEHVLQKEDYTQDALLMPATSAIVESIQNSAGAIGYIGLGYAAEAGDKIKVLGVKSAADSPAVMPSKESVFSGTYSIARPLFLITSGEPQGPIKGFVDFCLSAEGQQIVEDVGYVTAK